MTAFPSQETAGCALVEVEKSPKPVASCAMPAVPGMKIFTDTPLVKKAREGVMEFLLANHPLDCPICDQGGECDLQDQSMEFGGDSSRFKEIKRTVEDKNIGPLVKTIMTRCIHCTRCVRFTTEVAGVTDMGTTGRGNGMEIGTYVSKVLDTEMSGNVIDLCPVGALTSKPFAFRARTWELEMTESVDCIDAVGAAIRIDSRGTEVLRIVPRLHEEVNEEWLSDRSRFSYDGLKRQRLDTPMVKKDGKLQPTTWKEALLTVADKLQSVKGNEVLGVSGDLMDAEAIISLKDFLNRIGCSNLTPAQVEAPLSADIRSQYLFNSSIFGIEDADAALLIGTNPRMEAPLVNARLRKCVEHYGLEVASVGPASNTTYDKAELGADLNALNKLADGSHPFAKVLASAERPMIIVGMSALAPDVHASTQAAIGALLIKFPNLQTEDWNGINYLHTASGRVAAQDLGFTPGLATPAAPKVVYLLGADNSKLNIPEDAFVIYQGSHGDVGASRADVILPGAAYTEKEGTYVNMEGRAQRTRPATDTPGQAKQDWAIIRALSEVTGVTLPYDDLAGVQARLADVAPHMGKLGSVEGSTFHVSPTAGASKGTLAPYYTNHWFSNPISRSSVTMAKCTEQMPTATNSYC
eukprot:CAMPEP_0175092450 /NCGR_PEP_ID=MMETSP0086_2-20121207/2470_1 /TAXON_ID=136419 /ORGANISM="Unknown Unknown, Strain D1" /LENGTH=637 /DNA_ID=CAMNT_0016365315 /DNA_START=237 /DNA_END=2152 /DNA_ORIENTATION=-